MRELANVIERAVVMGQPPTVNIEDLPQALHGEDADEPIIARPSSYHESVDAFRRELIVKTLQQAQGNRSAAARLLGTERSYFLKLMKSFEIT